MHSAHPAAHDNAVRVTIAQLASRLNLAKSTVSIGLRDDLRLPLATRQRIQEAARELGYRPDPNLAVIASMRWRHSDTVHGVTIGLLDSGHRPSQRVRQLYLDSARTRLEELGYCCTVFKRETYRTASSLNRVLQSRAVRGMVVPPVFEEAELAGIDWSGMAVSGCGIGAWHPPFPIAISDVFEGLQLAIERLVALGYRRIAIMLVTHALVLPDDDRRIGSFLRQRERFGAAGVELHVWFRSPTGDNLRQFVPWWRGCRPEVVVGFNQGYVNVLESIGIRVPQDTPFAALNVWSHGSAVAGVDPQHGRIGRAAAELIDQQIRHNQYGLPGEAPSTLLIPPLWRDGDTLPPAPNRTGPSQSRRRASGS